MDYLLNCSKSELDKEKKKLEKKFEKYNSNLTNNKKTCSLAIMPTFDCNLRCIYCYADGGSTKNSIKLEVATKALDYVRKQNPKANEIELYLVGGGEPLLDLEKILKIVNYAEKIFKKVFINVVTNGTFNEKTREWLIQRRANIRISFDSIGQKEQRPFHSHTDSTEIVKNNIKYLIEKKADIMIQCIITSETVSKMKEIVDELLKLKVSIVKFEPCLMTDVSRGTKLLQPDPIEFATQLMNVIEYIASNDLPIMIDTGYFSKPTTGKYCGMGNGNFTVTPDGLITSCVEVSRKCDPYAEKVIFGEVKHEVEINEDNMQFLSQLHYKHQKGGCKECEYRLICLGGCPMANIWQNGLPLTKSNFTCTIEHVLLPKLLSRMIEEEKIIKVICENPKKSYN